MFSQNGKQPILTDLRGCFPHAEVKKLWLKESRNKNNNPAILYQRKL